MNGEEIKSAISIAVGICRTRAQDKNLDINESQKYTNDIIDKLILKLNDITSIDSSSIEKLIISIEEKSSSSKSDTLKKSTDESKLGWLGGRSGEVDW